ncbi:caspase family protein [Mesorhizobium sp. B2-3-4]|nr:caspase family protein [Mesorhizobium sp. B2-3-4]
MICRGNRVGFMGASLSRVSALVLVMLAALLGGMSAGRAGVVMNQSCEGGCADTLKAWLSAEQSAWFPVLAGPAERFEVTGDQAACPARQGAQPIVHAIVLAPYYRHFLKLPGTQNDAVLLKALFEKRGVAPENLHVMDGDAVTRKAVLDVMRSTIACARERDQVVVSFSGGASSYMKWGARSDPDGFLSRRCSDPSLDAETRRDLCADTVRTAVSERFLALEKNFNEHVLFTSDTIVVGHTRMAEGSAVIGIRTSELSNFAIQLQNRGADVIFIFDTNYAEDFKLLEQNEAARYKARWHWQRGDDSTAPPADAVELFGAGEMAALYATRWNELGYETSHTGDVVLGELTFAVSQALRSNPSPTIEQLAREVDRTMAAQNRDQMPVFEATNPNLRFLATRDEPQSNPDRIEVINPKLSRGATPIHDPQMDIVARYRGPGPAAFASIDGVNVEIDANGQFRRPVKLETRGELPIRVYGRDASLLSERRLLFGESETVASLAPVGRRLALVIANQHYADPAFPTLRTPIDDGKAVAQLLAQRFGYTTTLTMASGTERSLLLTDATKADIQKVLFDLRKSLTAEDQLLIYYAGHGQTDQENTAYWVPVDGDASEDFTWVRAFEITEDLRKLASGSVLLISDSCYAGGLSRDAVKAPEGPRDRYLAKSTRFKARQLIASGGDEPVQDGGGGDHSLFTRALLDGLAEMPDKVFTANELFAGKVKPKAVEYAFATSANGQTPVFYRMVQAGDEPESEFVFVGK